MPVYKVLAIDGTEPDAGPYLSKILPWSSTSVASSSRTGVLAAAAGVGSTDE